MSLNHAQAVASGAKQLRAVIAFSFRVVFVQRSLFRVELSTWRFRVTNRVSRGQEAFRRLFADHDSLENLSVHDYAALLPISMRFTTSMPS